MELLNSINNRMIATIKTIRKPTPPLKLVMTALAFLVSEKEHTDLKDITKVIVASDFL